MATRTPALRRAPVVQGDKTGHAQPAKMAAIAPANIEQAADLGAGYVILKLRAPSASPQAIHSKRKQPQPAPDADFPLMTRGRLASALERGGKLIGFPAPKVRPDENKAFMRKMAERETARRADLIEQGALITASELSERLLVSRPAISKALKANRLFALEGDGGRLWFPAFFADGGLSRRDLSKVVQALGDIPPSSKWQFFATPKASLGGVTPLEALRRGDRQAVMITAAGFVER